MSTNLNYQDISPDEGKARVSIPLSGLTILIIIIIVGILVGILPIFEPAAKNAEANLVEVEIKEISQVLEKGLS
ncbi:unnamed protein product, partial [marine sediment metagenome]